MDDMRSMLGITHERWTKELENAALGAFIAAAKSLITSGHDVTLDNTHLNPTWLRRYRKEIGPLIDEFVVHDLTDVSLEECLERDANRENGVGEKVVRRLAGRLEESRKSKWRLTDEWMNVVQYPSPKPYEAPVGGSPCYICDIDGTVAINDGHRGHYEYESVADDLPNTPVINTVQKLMSEAEIIFVSGREDNCRTATEEWLKDNLGFFHAPQLHMRKTHDYRPDYVIKGELFDAHIRDHYDVLGVFDDRDQVVKMWRSIGLTVFQVADGNF